MKKSWILMVLTVPFLTSCADDTKVCVEGEAFCKSGDGGEVVVVCKDGELIETTCGANYRCSAEEKACVFATQCANSIQPTCENGRIKYCANNIYVYTECENGCSTATNACNPISAGKGECTKGAVRCNREGEREICDSAGMWKAHPCCEEGDAECVLVCDSGACVSSIKEGATRCASDRTYEVFTDGKWSEAQPCDADKPMCDESKGACVPAEVSYCGDVEVELNDGSKVKLQDYCDSEYGAGKTVGACEGSYYSCMRVCDASKVGESYQVCGTYQTTSGGEADFAGEGVCVDFYDGEHYGVAEDQESFKNCKNACNEEGTTCDEHGFAGGGSGGGEVTYCGDVDVEMSDGSKKKLQEACDEMYGKGNAVGVCVGMNVTCLTACEASEVGKTFKICDTYQTTTGGEADFAGEGKCSDVGKGHYGVIEDDSTFKNCKNACNAEGTDCDDQGYADGGDSGGDGGDEVKYCGDVDVEMSDGSKMKLQEACDKMYGKGNAVGVCVGLSVTCFFTCKASDVGKTYPICDTYQTTSGGEADFAGEGKCSDVGEGHYSIVEDDASFKACKNACNAEGTDCDDQGFADGGDSGGLYFYCGDQKYKGSTIDQYCATEGSGLIGVCYESEGEVYFECAQTCTTAQVGNRIPACILTEGISFAYNDVCTKFDDQHLAYVMDENSIEMCSGSCNASNTACK